MKRLFVSLITSFVCFASHAQAPAGTSTNPAPNANQQTTSASDSAPYTPLSEEDLYILKKGEISDSRYVFGTLLSIVPGFGVGHAVNKQFGKSGWLFLAGEGAGVGIMYVGVLACIGDNVFEDKDNCNNALIDVGVITFLGFKIWEVVDAITRPPKHNARFRELQAEKKSRNALFLVPRTDSIGANLVYTF